MSPLPPIPAGAIPILYYHRVQAPPAGFATWPRQRQGRFLAYDVLPTAFVAQLDWLTDHGYDTRAARTISTSATDARISVSRGYNRRLDPHRGPAMLRPEEAYEGYERAWNEPGRAATLLEKVWAPEGVYADDDVPDGVVGPAALAALIAETHEALPGFRVWATSAPRMLAERMAITWAGEGGNPPIPHAGTDIIEFGPDGRITRITDALDID